MEVGVNPFANEVPPVGPHSIVAVISPPEIVVEIPPYPPILVSSWGISVTVEDIFLDVSGVALSISSSPITTTPKEEITVAVSAAVPLPFMKTGNSDGVDINYYFSDVRIVQIYF